MRNKKVKGPPKK